MAGILACGAFASVCNAEKYETKEQPQSEAAIKKYGKLYDVKNVNLFPIPDVLERLDKKGKTASAEEWAQQSRPLVMNFIDEEMYGRIPPRPDTLKFELAESSDDALGGIAIRRQYKIVAGGKNGDIDINVLVYLPKGAKGKIPAFICPNFGGNHTVSPEKEVFLPTCRLSSKKQSTAYLEKKRAGKLTRIPVADIVSRGFAVATFCYCDLYPDYNGEEALKESVYKIFGKDSEFAKGPAIVAWAWGNMRVMDLLQTMPQIDTQHIAVAGHSRLSKTALITGSHDPRFAYVCANNGGCMGEALSKRRYGESLASMVDINFPYWFSPNLKKYGNNEGALPIDQHHLLASIAPRMLYVTSSAEDYWADPEGQLLGLIHACPVYALFGGKNFPTLDALEIEKPFHGDVAYHIRSGRHNITRYDWKNFMDYAVLRGWKPVPPKK